MPNHVALLSDAESRRLATGTLFVVRPVVPQPRYTAPFWSAVAPRGTLLFHGNMDTCCSEVQSNDPRIITDSLATLPNPLGAVGDTLLCKEAWAITDMFLLPEYAVAEFNSGEATAAYCGKIPGAYDVDDLKAHTVYRADKDRAFYWRPASTMPLWAVRHRPIVTEAGAMRVGDMTEEQCRDAGIAPDMEDSGGTDGAGQWIEVPHYSPAFAAYWNRRYPKYPYESSPWVWYATVKREEHNANP